MHVDRARNTRVRAAIALSIAGHLCALMLLALLAGGSSIFSSSTIDEISPVTRLTFVHRERRRPAPPPIAALPVVRATQTPLPPRPTVAPLRVVLAARARPATPLATRRVTPAAAVADVADAAYGGEPAGPPRPAIVAAPASATPAPTAAPTATPQPTAVPSATVTATPAAAGDFGGLFSQNYPPALPVPAMLATIRARLSGQHGRIRIAVDDAGRASDVQFIGPAPDTTIAQEIRNRLLNVTYVPADCNGLHCEGTLELSY